MKEIRFIESLYNAKPKLIYTEDIWCVYFSVGFTRTEYIGNGKTLHEAITDAVKYWKQGKELWDKFV